ncbi:UNVERIFIED_CONTAM: hypothetical protein FKN15_027683 [Acipenser sinensis]
MRRSGRVEVLMTSHCDAPQWEGGGADDISLMRRSGRVESGRDLQQYQSQAKQLFRKLNEQSPPRCTLEAGVMSFHYVIEKGVCYLVLCEAGFPKKLAFAYLEDLQSEFDEQHGKRVPTVSRPYSFIEFDTYIQKTKKSYIDSRARRNLGNINTELQDVQRIMVANIEESGRDLQQYQSQAKQLFRKLNEQSPPRCTLEAGVMSFHYVIEKGVCYLVLCEAGFPKKLAFAYLEDLQSEFDEQHGKRVPTVSRPYSFIEFDTYIQKTKKSYIDSRARRNLGNINTELQDVQRIMVANIEEVLQRGEALSALDSKASNLSSLSKKYRSDAKYLNTRSTYAKLAAVGVFLVMLIVYVRFWWL